ncbi:hypothetical protein [Streptomyces echinatus]|uniref:hypothetical protein n=1 Tax=Streptomyces echinatus TaxID=67293 RepID=UPI0037FAB43B
MKAPFFAEHMREELILHRWDLTGDDRTSVQSLTEPWMTEHSVVSVGRPLLEKGRRLATPEGPAAIESDAAVRVLLLWGRRPADPNRWHSSAGPETLLKVRALLGGY